MRRERRRHRTRQYENDVRTNPAHRLRQAIAGGAKSTGDKRGKFPPEHEHAHTPNCTFYSDQPIVFSTACGLIVMSRLRNEPSTGYDIKKLR
jgi:hypothetical protein